MKIKKIIYFDNSATSHFKPKSIKKCVNDALKISANPGRSGHKLSLKNSFKVWQAREIVAKHFGLSEPENVIFTKNCTEALNIAILGTVKKGGNVVCSCFEHNSVLRPLFQLKNSGDITLTIIEPSNKKYIVQSDVLRAIISKTYLVCVTAVSNVTGNKNDIFEIAKVCREKNILFLTDCAQACGHFKIDMKKSNIDYLTFAGHKGFLTPQGIGGLCINSKIIPNPIMFGGTGTESINTTQPENLPERLESGTLPTPLILALAEGVKFVEKHFEENSFRVLKLTAYLLERLKEIRDIEIYSLNSSSSGVVSFNLKNYTSEEICEFLDKKYNIATRGGLHCAPLTHKFLGTINKGAVRVSINFKNTKHEIDTLIKALKEFNEK